MKLSNKIGAVAISVALALGVSPAMALAADSMAPVEKKTVQWLSTEKQPEFAKTITVGGVEYTLTGEPAIKEVKTETGKAPADHTEIKECWPADLNSTIAGFPETWPMENDDYKGDIPRTDVTYEAVMAQRTWEVNSTQTYSGLPSNDVNQIAREVSYTNPDNGHDLTLALASINWAVSSTDANGMPTGYTANCIYRGTDTDTVVDHYVVTAKYEGEIASKKPVTTYEATLTYQGPVPETTPANNEEGNGIDLLPIVVGAMVAAGAGVFFWVRRNNVSLCKVSADGSALEEKARLRATNGANGLKLEIPANYTISDGRWAVVLRKSIADGSRISISWCGKNVYTGAAAERIEL